MSLKHSFTTADYLEWDTATNLVRKLYRDKKYTMSLLLGCGIFFGLRISDLLSLTWNDIIGKSEFILFEHKTGKRRVIKINSAFQGHIKDCHTALSVKDDANHCFLNRFGGVISLQMVNRHFKAIKFHYGLRINNFSSHTLRKTWARKIYENENNEGRGEMALLKLSEIMNHSAPNITRRYIGLRQQELGEVYDSLSF